MSNHEVYSRQAFFLWDVIRNTSLPIKEKEIAYEEWFDLSKESPGSEIGYLRGIIRGTNLSIEVKELIYESLWEIKDWWAQCAPLVQPVPPTQSVFLAQPLPIKSVVHMESDPRFSPPSVPSVMPSLAVTSAPPPVESVPPVIESVVSSDQPTLAFETVEPVPQPITQLISGVQTLTEREIEKKEPIHNGTTYNETAYMGSLDGQSAPCGVAETSPVEAEKILSILHTSLEGLSIR